MTTAVLVRAPFRALEVAENWDRSLLAEACTLLGYRPAAIQEAEQTRLRSANENILARALEAAGIEPFTLSSVASYKKAMLRKSHKGESWKLTRYMHRGDGESLASLVGWPAWLSAIATSIICGVGHYSGYAAGWGWDGHQSLQIIHYMSAQTAQAVMFGPALLMASWTFLMYLRHKGAHQVNAGWNAFPVGGQPGYNNGYARPIPAFAIQRMISLKKELPEVAFHVEELNASVENLETQKNPRPLPPDPFLIATFRGISCYVDVWDEPGFEGRRTI